MSSFFPWKVLHVEMSEGIPSLQKNNGLGGFFTVFWWCGIPLGHVEIPASNLPLAKHQVAELAVQKISSAVGDYLLENGFRADLPVVSRYPLRDKPVELSALLCLDRPLEILREQYSLQAKEELSESISVVVCTRDRPDRLQKCLRALEELSQRPQEILVVDNAPKTEATYRLVSKKQGIGYLLEARPGLSAARNAGIRNTSGDIIAFTDDDVIVHPDWIIRLQGCFRDPKVMAATGLILPVELETEAQFIFQHEEVAWEYRALTFDSLFFNKMKSRGAPVWRIGAGANMAFRRKAFELVGYFDERLGAGTSGCSEDSELWYRLLAEGWLCHYEPTAVVHHYHRHDMNTLREQMFQYMRGHVVALLIQYEKYRQLGNLYRAFGILPWYLTKRFLGQLRRGINPKASTIREQIMGCFAGVKYYFQHRQSTGSSEI